jgi:diguanylate cyclase (GGDEF)-like protein
VRTETKHRLCRNFDFNTCAFWPLNRAPYFINIVFNRIIGTLITNRTADGKFMNLTRNLILYASLDRFRFLKQSYIAKIMGVAFLGTHIPLLTLLFSFILSNSLPLATTIHVLVIALIATLAGTAATLYALHHLLTPVILTSAALQNYLNTKTLPKLPTGFTDEAGTLMADTAQTLHELDELIQYISHYDELTGLPNRELFCSQLHQDFSQTDNHQPLVGLLLVSIDDFPIMSQGLDRETLRLFLRAFVQRLKACLEPMHSLACIGTDEFAIAITDINTLESVINLAQLVLSTQAKSFSIEGTLIRPTASIGIAINTLQNTQDVDSLLQQAQIALRQAKQRGCKQYQFYSPEMNVQLQERFALENALHGALERSEFSVYYQPIVCLSNGQIVGLEALVRWQHPELGLISPVKFIPIAEANGLIVPIGEWVLRTACAQTYAWQIAGWSPLRISVNLSARQFEQSNLAEVVSQILKETRLDASDLELEVTESSLVVDIQRSVNTLKQLRELGISVALDDFGTGYSSLNYLKRFPVNMLKIDRSFVQDLISNPDSAAITDAIIALAQSLKLSITAEGIETQEQLHYLQSKGCDEGQGFYFSRPIPAEAMRQLLTTKMIAENDFTAMAR